MHLGLYLGRFRTWRLRESVWGSGKGATRGQEAWLPGRLVCASVSSQGLGQLPCSRRPPLLSAIPGMPCDRCAHSKPPSLET